MVGARLADGQPPRNPGEYSWMPYSPRHNWPPDFVGDGEWHLMDPTGGVGACGRQTREKPTADHTWVEHEDGTVTFSPSLVMPCGWHGYLRQGVWTTA